MFKNFIALGLSTLVRVLTGFVLFVLIAKHWGASSFGQFMYLFSVVSLLVLACEFGFSQQILREVGRTPERASQLMASYMGAKVWLTVFAFVLALLFVIVTRQTLVASLTLLLLLLAATLLSYSDFLLACMRALGRFSNETRVTLKGNLICFAAGLAALYAGGGFLGVSVAWMCARLLHMLITWKEYRRHVPERLRLELHAREVIPVIRRGAAYGVDGMVATVFMNIDTILISHMLGSAATGLYQAGVRFYQGACLIPPIFGSLYLPRLARAVEDKNIFGHHFRQLSRGLMVSGLLFTLGFVFSEFYIGFVFKEADFSSLETLLPWFGVLLFTRYIASIYGTVLTALGGQSMRVVIYMISLLTMIVFALMLMPVYGVVGMIFAVTIANVVLVAGLGWWISRYRLRIHAIWLASVIAAALFGFVYWKTGIKIG